MRFPRLNRARYLLTFELVHPNVEAHFEARDAFQIFHDGTPMATGQTFDVAQQLGWILLDEVSILTHRNILVTGRGRIHRIEFGRRTKGGQDDGQSHNAFDNLRRRARN